MIHGIANLETIFQVFHDGSITAGEPVEGTLRLRIAIPYLAERMHPNYTSFQVTLCDVHALSFRPWTIAESDPLTDPIQIFAPELEILDCASEGHLLLITCNQTAAEYDYWGGQLIIQASAARVCDEAGREQSLAELLALATAYWDEWEAGNQVQRESSSE